MYNNKTFQVYPRIKSGIEFVKQIYFLKKQKAEKRKERMVSIYITIRLKMIERILEHMNNEHRDVLPLYVRHFNGRDDVAEARLTGINEDEMILEVNGGEEIRVKLTGRTELKDVHMELVKMAKIARQALGIPAPAHHKEKSHPEEEKLKMEISDFIGEFKSILIATVDKEGYPVISYSPYVRHQGDNYIFISETGDHFGNLKENGKLEVSFIEDEIKTSSISLRRRVRYRAVAEFLPRDEKFEEIMNEFEKIDTVIRMTRTMKDFSLVRLTFGKGRYVKGAGKAFNITEDRRIVPLTQDTHGHRQ